MRPFRTLHINDSFGRMAFLTGSPHRTVAITKTESVYGHLHEESATRACTITRNSVKCSGVFFHGGFAGAFLPCRRGCGWFHVNDGRRNHATRSVFQRRYYSRNLNAPWFSCCHFLRNHWINWIMGIDLNMNSAEKYKSQGTVILQRCEYEYTGCG